jgi:hypothetical protein
MPKRKLGPLKNLANFANPNMARTTARRLKNVSTKAKGKENEALVLPVQREKLGSVRVFSTDSSLKLVSVLKL